MRPVYHSIRKPFSSHTLLPHSLLPPVADILEWHSEIQENVGLALDPNFEDIKEEKPGKDEVYPSRWREFMTFGSSVAASFFIVSPLDQESPFSRIPG